jgi:hypothetical protein
MGENEVLNAGMWFFAGVLAHKAGTWIFLNSYAFLFVEQAVAQALNILRYADQNVAAAIKVSQESHSEIKSKEELEEIKNKDELFISLWRIHSIKTLLNHCTPNMRRKLNFSNWFQAMNYLDKREENKL